MINQKLTKHASNLLQSALKGVDNKAVIDAVKDAAEKDQLRDWGYFNYDDNTFYADCDGVVLSDKEYKLINLEDAIDDWQDNQADYKADGTSFIDVLSNVFENNANDYTSFDELADEHDQGNSGWYNPFKIGTMAYNKYDEWLFKRAESTNSLINFFIDKITNGEYDPRIIADYYHDGTLDYDDVSELLINLLDTDKQEVIVELIDSNQLNEADLQALYDDGIIDDDDIDELKGYDNTVIAMVNKIKLD